jgi:hypothetical protein
VSAVDQAEYELEAKLDAFERVIKTEIVEAQKSVIAALRAANTQQVELLNTIRDELGAAGIAFAAIPRAVYEMRAARDRAQAEADAANALTTDGLTFRDAIATRLPMRRSSFESSMLQSASSHDGCWIKFVGGQRPWVRVSNGVPFALTREDLLARDWEVHP